MWRSLSLEAEWVVVWICHETLLPWKSQRDVLRKMDGVCDYKDEKAQEMEQRFAVAAKFQKGSATKVDQVHDFWRMRIIPAKKFEGKKRRPKKLDAKDRRKAYKRMQIWYVKPLELCGLC
jgi:ribosomal protein RSM22 (predicted rRNA methylase)